ncbi:MAG: carbohydrate ABC transporter permease [Geminicoccaceae bacterium]
MATRDDRAAFGGPARASAAARSGLWDGLSRLLDRHAPAVFIMPAVLLVLAMSIFPLLVSLYLSLSRFRFVKGGFELEFIGLLNYEKLLLGSQQFHFLGTFGELSAAGWAVLGIAALGLVALLVRYVRDARYTLAGLLLRSLAAAGTLLLVLLIVLTGSGDGHPGSLVVTLFYVGIGVTAQYGIGLGLALLCAQNLPGRKLFRVVFFLPMMVTPVGIAYTFRMLTDTTKGPFTPIWQYFGWAETSWVVDPWGARVAVMIGDAWQWIPFMFVVLLVAIESQPQDQREAALVDGANRWQVFRYVTWPAILPVSVTVVLIRAIEAFKIIDLPNVLTNGGPGIASESMTLHAYVAWRTLDLGGSAAIAYLLLFVVAFVCLSMLALLRPAEREAGA